MPAKAPDRGRPAAKCEPAVILFAMACLLAYRGSKNSSSSFEQRAHRIAGDTSNPLMLGWSRAAADAEFDLARVRQAKIVLMDMSGAVSLFHLREPSESPTSGVSLEDSDRFLKAVRATLAELVKIDRYEQRAASRLDNALRQIVRFRKLTHTEETQIVSKARVDTSSRARDLET
jgi:hypothetical protein